MNIIEKQWEHGSYLAYENVEPELLNFKPGARVLPAPYYYEKALYFELIRMYQPGDHIIRQKDVAKGMFFIIRGSVTVTSDDGEVLFAELNAPGYCKFFVNSWLVGEIGLVYNGTFFTLDHDSHSYCQCRCR